MRKIQTGEISRFVLIGPAQANIEKTALAVFRLPSLIFHTLNKWQERVDMRAQMRELDARLLEDVGLTRLDTQQESNKPFWSA